MLTGGFLDLIADTAERIADWSLALGQTSACFEPEFAYKGKRDRVSND